MNDQEIIDRFAAHQHAANRSDNTILSYRLYFRHWIDWLARQPHSPTITTATRDDVEGFLATRRIAPRTRYHYLQRLSVLYQWAIDEDLTATDPTRRIPRPTRPRNHPRPISRDDLYVAVRAAGVKMRLWLLLGAFAGLRCQEIGSITVEDLFLDRDPPLLLVSNPKGWRQRTVPLHPDIVSAVHGWGIPRAGYLFPHLGVNPSKPVAPWTVSHDIAKHLRSCGVDATAHQLRHFFATELYQLSQDIRLTQGLLGHQDLASTAVYAQWDRGRPRVRSPG